MDFKTIEDKWQKYWNNNNVYKFDVNKANKKYYMLEMFSYPSGAKLHLGHWWNYGLSDSFSRFKRMQGFDVFHPMGFDAFGLPAENYAIKTGIHPHDSTMKNIAVMEDQLKKMGATYDWDYEIKTCTPDYYKWTQWLFLKLYEHKLAYQKYAPVNWCPSCNTVLANEQVSDGKCERCSSEVLRKKLTQWFFKITDYADKLLDHSKLDWPEKTITLQKNWIDKSVGGEVWLQLENSDSVIKTFTTRADTLFGVSFVVVAPEHPLLEKITTLEQKELVNQYIKNSLKKSEIERSSSVSEKTGVFTGSYVINPLSKDKVPVFVGDYVIGSYGTGAVIGVAAHDTRDYDFAKKYNLPIKRVIASSLDADNDLPFIDKGVMVDSAEFTGLESDIGINKILETLESINMGSKKINYRLRDWSVSRQRYWGCPIPMIHCDDCGTVPVPEKDLPVELPYNVDWTPKGTSPLAGIDEYINCKCPKCGKDAKRDPDTLDTFVCSSWYFLRYPNANNNKEAFNTDWTNKILPVDKYVGGIEHACGHLLYSRFITKFLYDKGYINFDEPFLSLVHQGLILGGDGFKMSKSRGNTVSADEIINEFGSDALRLYLMFGFNYLEGGPWSYDGISSISKFIDRLARIVEKCFKLKDKNFDVYGAEEKELECVLHSTIKSVTQDMEKFSFNTSVARIMELVNAMYKYDSKDIINEKLFSEVALKLVLLVAPMIPHTAEEMYDWLDGHKTEVSVFNLEFPSYQEEKLVRDTVEYALQVNNKIITKDNFSTSTSDADIEALTLKNEKIKTATLNKQIIKVIVIKNRLVNIIVK